MKMMVYAKVKAVVFGGLCLAIGIGAAVVAAVPGEEHDAASTASVTQQAMQAVRSVHIRIEPAGQGIGEAWAVFTEDHKLLKLRMDFPQTEDGPKMTVWENDKAIVWFKKKNAVATLTERNILQQLRQLFDLLDPKPRVDALLEDQGQRGDGVVIEQPAGKDKPIVITISDPVQPTVLFVNAATKLVDRIEKYQVKNGQRTLLGRTDYSDYDTVDPKVFTPELPADAIRVDSTAQDVGLEKGQLSDNEIAVKVARQFVEAMVAKDYQTAGKLCGGVPAETMRQQFGGLGYVRLVRIGEPYPHRDPRTMFICVPVEIEVNADGRTEVKTSTFNIRPVYGQMHRWAIGGGL